MPPGISRRAFLGGTVRLATGSVAAELALLGLAPPIRAESPNGAPVKQGKETASLCPYCAVGCGQIVTSDASGQIIDIQGNPDSPISEGTLCPKGAATYQLVVNPMRWIKVRYRGPGTDHWEDKPLDWAMERIAQLVKATRDANFNETQDIADDNGRPVTKRVMNTYAIASLGGATMDNEWNYIHQKLMRALGVVYMDNQARI